MSLPDPKFKRTQEPLWVALDTPALLLDRKRLDANLRRMEDHVRKLGIGLRPHLKTAKSIDVARRALPDGGGITVSTLREAFYFADNGFRDIFYAVAIVPQKLAQVVALMRRGVRILIAVDDPAAAQFVADASRRCGLSFEVMIEVDSGEHRSGVPPDSDVILEIARTLTPSARIAGVFTHGGHSYAGRTTAEHAMVAEQERLAATEGAKQLRTSGYACPVVSVGSTPSVLFAEHMEGVTEARAGVYMFGDLSQVALGTCCMDDLAVSVLTTVIGKHAGHRQLVVDAGGLAMSKDPGPRGGSGLPESGYGLVCLAQDAQPIQGLYIHSLYQEHGIVRSRGSFDIAAFPIGTRLRILPNHACLTAAAFDKYHVLPGENTPSVVWPRVNGW